MQDAHNCVRELRVLVRDQGESICKAQQDMTDMRYALTEQKRELQLLKELVRAMRISNPGARALQDQVVCSRTARRWTPP